MLHVSAFLALHEACQQKMLIKENTIKLNENFILFYEIFILTCLLMA